MHPGKEIPGEFVVARGDGAELLELIEEALDEISFAVECEVACARSLAVGLGWDDRGDLALDEDADEWIGVVSFVADQGIWVDVLDQRFGASKIMRLSGGEHQLDGIAQRIGERMNLGGQSAA